MGSLRFGAQQAIHKCVRVRPGENVVLITDRATAEIADALLAEIRSVPADARRFVMEDFGARPDSGERPLAFPAEIGAAMRAAQVSIYAASGKKGELATFRQPMLEVVDATPGLRHAHMINVTREIMETGMSADYDVIQELSAKVAEILRASRSIRVTTPAGTDFRVTIHPEWKWVVSDGRITQGKWKNLPDGEVFTCAESAEGHVVVDGCLGDYFSALGSCESFPVFVDLHDGWVTRLTCPARPQLEKELVDYIHQDANAHRVGEFAVGTNVGLDRIIGNLLQDEKFPGVHIAIGHGYPEKTGSPWKSQAHVDMVLRRVTIDVDGRVIMRDGRFVIGQGA